LVFSVGVTRAVGAMRVLFVGATPTVAALEGLLARNSQYGMMPVGYWAGAAGGAAEMLGEVERLRPDRIVVARPEELRPGWVDAFLELHFGGVRTERASELYEDTLGRVCLAEVRPEQVIYEGLFDPPASSLKLQEIYSRGIAALLALATLPLAVLIAALVKLTSRGPLLEREVRLGLDDRPVTLLRFRWWEERDGVRRPTRIGRGLRLFNLDALPRLHNVLRGDLSLIGPAAVRPEFAAALSERLPLFRQRHKVKPGLMGWAQICAGAIEELPDELELLEYDLYYLKNLSPSLDTFVLLRWLKTWLHGFFKIDS
jgi:lipopolysaccharide/colanic/teichoic acid biosynthesis glycosyltransferase